jgi:hypothetical protein
MDFRALMRVGCFVAFAACGKVNSLAPDAKIIGPDAKASAQISVVVTGLGTVISDPAGITCSVADTSACSATFAIGTMVTLTPSPESPYGATISGWSGVPCSAPSMCSLTVAEDANVTAVFVCGHGMQTFAVTSAMQPVTFCGTLLTVDAQAGAGGNSSTGGIGGNGGRVQATLTLAAVGEPVVLFVGDVGGVGNAAGGLAGFNGGGVGGLDAAQTGGGGGGATDIRVGGSDLTNRVIVAGGGGGGATCGGVANTGAVGGGLTGGVGTTSCGMPTSPAEPGTQTGGGIGGVYPSYTSGTPGISGVGGSANGNGGGGGGGGYYGGGGAAWGGGAGGSSYTDPVKTTNVTHTQGFHAGAGQLIITY